MAERSYNGRNLLTGLNGDFENAPAFAAAQTTNGNWIDGTATGSVANDIYKWEFIKDAGTVSARFDPDVAFSGSHSIKVDATDASGRGRVVFGSNSGTGASLAASMLATYAIRVKPNRQYTLSYRVKGITLAGSGGRISVHEHNSNGTRVGLTQPAGSVTGTLDWTLATGTFTTNINTQYLVLSAEQASAGIQTLWFDDISLTEVLPARTLATSRTTASNRVAVRDMGTALRFDGVDDEVAIDGVVASLGNIMQTPYTFSAWFMTTSTAQQTILSCGRTNSDSPYIILDIGQGTPGKPRFTNRSDSNLGDTAQTTTIKANDGKFHQIVGVSTSTALYLYFDGVLVASDLSATGGTATLNVANIGVLERTTKSGYFNGIIDEPRIWNRALTADEVQKLYLYGIVPRDGLVAEYLFDEASGTTALDTSGNGNDGTITGATYTTDTPLQPRTSV